MDEFALSRAQIKTLAKQDENVSITAYNGDLQAVFVERTKYRGNTGEGKWLLADGKYRKEDSEYE